MQDISGEPLQAEDQAQIDARVEAAFKAYKDGCTVPGEDGKSRRPKPVSEIYPLWAAMWQAFDFSWDGLADAAWERSDDANEAQKLKRWRAPVDFLGGGTVEGEGEDAYKQASLQDYWRWSLGILEDGLPGRLLDDEELAQLGLLKSVDGVVYFLLHCPGVRLHAGIEQTTPENDFRSHPQQALAEDGSGGEAGATALLARMIAARLTAGKREGSQAADERLQAAGTRAAGLDQVLRAYFTQTPSLINLSAPLADLDGFDVSEVTLGDGVRFAGATLGDGANFSRATLGDRANFSYATLGDGANFFRTTLGGRASFFFATLGDSADFIEATLGDSADFSNATLGDGARFSGATLGDGANFNEATLGDGANFFRTTLGDRANFSGATLGDSADFIEATLSDGANFSRATLGDRAGFSGATLGDGARFSGATLGDGANFVEATLGDGANFIEATLGDGADFSRATLGDGANFYYATLGDGANFSYATLGDRANFSYATLGDSADFIEATLGDGADFSRATLGDGADFSRATLGDGARFTRTTLGDGADFSQATISKNARFEGTSFGDNAKFNRTSIGEGTQLSNLHFGDGAQFQETNLHEGGFLANLRIGRDSRVEGLAFPPNLTVLFQTADGDGNERAGLVLGDSSSVSGARFGDNTKFVGKAPVGVRAFRRCEFNGFVDFSEMEWDSDAFYGGLFEGARFRDLADFQSPNFCAFPAFDAATFYGTLLLSEPENGERHETLFDRCQKVALNELGNNPTRLMRNRVWSQVAGGYRAAKKAMEAQGDFDREQTYYRFEVKARVRRPSVGFFERRAAGFYALWSNYGESIWRPVAGLFTFTAVFAAIYLGLAASLGETKLHWAPPVEVDFSQSGIENLRVNGPSKSAWQAVEFSFNNAFRPLSALATQEPIEGTQGEPVDQRLADRLLFYEDGGWGVLVRVLAIIQSLLSFVLAFLFALAIRRKFQIS